jgi:hypothetical protein
VREATQRMHCPAIQILTDAIISEDKLDLDMGNACGDWAYEHEGEMVSVGTGIYQFRDTQAKVRGFMKKKVVSGSVVTEVDVKTGKNKPVSVDLFELLDTDMCVVKIPGIRPQQFKECIIQHRYKDIACFKSDDRDLTFSNCLKREFPEGLTGRDLLRGPIHGNALHLSILRAANKLCDSLA